MSEADLSWRPWSPAEVARRLAGVTAPWCVAGGWAVDLHLRRVTREHEDLEIAVPATEFGQVRRALADVEFDVVGSGRRWPGDDPVAFDRLHQTWFREPVTGHYRLDVFREPHDGDTWICRRDPGLRRPYRDVVRHTGDGVPYLVPEIVLLFKAKARRGKDEADLANLLPVLDVAQREWLARSLAAVHPGHPWLAVVAGSGA
jgi:hypothetical protein